MLPHVFSMWHRLKKFFQRREIDDAYFAELRETLLVADVGLALTDEWVAAVRKCKTAEDVQATLIAHMTAALQPLAGNIAWHGHQPTVVMIVGVNGVGKTTSIAKLAHTLQQQGQRPLLVAGDTFRAAAVEQLKVWGARLNVPVIAREMGADSASVAFDGIKAAQARDRNIVLVDTAGRLHTKVPLMDELGKVQRVMDKALPGAPHERWCVLDATTGQNMLAQVRQFHALLGLTGLIITKLDGTAKAGAIFSIAKEVPIPLRYTGHGEQADQLSPFDATRFVENLLQSSE